jgi:hypothetical protein
MEQVGSYADGPCADKMKTFFTWFCVLISFSYGSALEKGPGGCEKEWNEFVSCAKESEAMVPQSLTPRQIPSIAIHCTFASSSPTRLSMSTQSLPTQQRPLHLTSSTATKTSPSKTTSATLSKRRRLDSSTPTRSARSRRADRKWLTLPSRGCRVCSTGRRSRSAITSSQAKPSQAKPSKAEGV